MDPEGDAAEDRLRRAGRGARASAGDEDGGEALRPRGRSSAGRASGGSGAGWVTKTQGVGIEPRGEAGEQPGEVALGQGSGGPVEEAAGVARRGRSGARAVKASGRGGDLGPERGEGDPAGRHHLGGIGVEAAGARRPSAAKSVDLLALDHAAADRGGVARRGRSGASATGPTPSSSRGAGRRRRRGPRPSAGGCSRRSPRGRGVWYLPIARRWSSVRARPSGRPKPRGARGRGGAPRACPPARGGRRPRRESSLPCGLFRQPARRRKRVSRLPSMAAGCEHRGRQRAMAPKVDFRARVGRTTDCGPRRRAGGARELLMDYDALFGEQLDALRKEGNYRVFAELERLSGDFPRAPALRRRTGRPRSPSGARTTISAWASTRRCSRRCTRRSTAAAPAPAAPATSPAPPTTTCCWSASSPTCTARRRRCSSPPATSRTGRRSRRSAAGCPAA